jgi:HEAT repeat protein
MRPPHDPTPPPPPPPPPPSGGPPTPSAPPTPKALPPSTPGATPALTPSGGPGRTALSGDSWVFWYGYNRTEIEGLKDAIYRLVGSNHPLAALGGPQSGTRDAARQPTAALVRDRILPTLAWVMDPANRMHPDAESAAYIALGKVAREPAQIEEIQRGLATSPGARRPLTTREAAALALGLVRRGHAEDRFSAYELDRVRTFLFGVFENGKDYEDRVRGFAALSIGLLGDQPTGSGEFASDPAAAAASTTLRLFGLLDRPYANGDLAVGLLVAIGLQPSDSVGREVREALATCALRGRLLDREVDDVVRAHAASALGRIGGRDDVRTLRAALDASRRMPDVVVQSAAIGLGTLGRLLDGEDRADVARSLVASLDRVRDDGVRGFALVSLGRILAEEARASRTDVLEGARVGDVLLSQAAEGKPVHRPYAALALALAVEAAGETPDADAWGSFRSRALVALRDGLASPRLDKRNRAGFAVALGIASDERSVKPLVGLVADRKEDPELRGYASVALGLLGQRTDDVKRALRGALEERVSEELRVQTATGLGLLGDREAVPLLVRELRDAESQSVKGQVALALARIGDDRAVAPLLDRVRDAAEKDLTRALCCAGLGVVGDLESIPSLSRISRDVNYRADSDLMREVLSIL